MNLHEMFQNSFSAVSPVKSNDELFKSVLERTKKMENKKKISLRKPLIAVCAAATIAVATISVGAANDWNYADVFQSIFGEKTENIIENIVPKAVILEDTIKNMDFEITAAAADKHSALIILDIYGRNGFKFTEKNLDNERWYFADLQNLDLGISVENVNVIQYSMNLIEGNENMMRVGITMYTEQELHEHKINICITELLTAEEDENTSYLSNNRWTAELVADYNAEEIVYEKEFLLQIENERETSAFISADKIEVSPISVHLSTEIDNTFGVTASSYADLFNILQGCENCFAVTDSGTKIKIVTFGKKNIPHVRSDLLIFSFAEPVNPEEINHIDLNGYIIEIK